jgi:hypothetical protein
MFNISINLTDSAMSLILVPTRAKALLPVPSLQMYLAVGSILQSGKRPIGALQAGDGGLSTVSEMFFGAIIH